MNAALAGSSSERYQALLDLLEPDLIGVSGEVTISLPRNHEISLDEIPDTKRLIEGVVAGSVHGNRAIISTSQSYSDDLCIVVWKGSGQRVRWYVHPKRPRGPLAKLYNALRYTNGQGAANQLTEMCEGLPPAEQEVYTQLILDGVPPGRALELTEALTTRTT